MSKEIKISEVLEMIEAGKTRPEIKEHYNLTTKEMAALNNHPLIKGKKAKTPLNITIIDDISEEELKMGEGENEEVDSPEVPELSETQDLSEGTEIQDFLEEDTSEEVKEGENNIPSWEN